VKVGVTGASGKVGKYVVAELLEHGYDVRAITPEAGVHSSVEQVQADVTRLEEVRKALEGCDAVIHLAAIPSPHGGTESQVIQTNVLGTYHVLLAAGECGISRAAAASSDCAFGITYSFRDTRPLYLPVDEDHPVSPDNSYGLSKVMAERAAEGIAKRFGMTIASLRITFVVEPHEYARRGFRQMTQNPLEGPWNLWSYLDVRDCARAFRLAIEAPFEGHEVFCIAAEHQRTVLSSRQLAEQYYPDADWRMSWNGFESLMSSAKARRILGFKPEYNWRDELDRS